MSNVVRVIAPQVESAEPEVPAQELPVDNRVSAQNDIESIRPADKGDGTVLQALGIGEELNQLPPEEQDNVGEMENYIFESLKLKGVTPTRPNIENELYQLKYDMGLDPRAEMSTVLDRIGGVIKAWKNLSFVKDPIVKKNLFFKLANAKSSKDMNKIVFDEMERDSVWQ
jgi:hypothetical protein